MGPVTGAPGGGRAGTGTRAIDDAAVAGPATVTVAGVDAAGNPAHPDLVTALARAGLVVGAARHLAAVPVPPG
ncbi:bifunctional cobalt-precorrin-7 (C(5))-methyltransferase/cobalt-precorrin-6B (C(15))-methyltransferase, partial [Salinispora arenicola]|nr:bifunctional cobalt-precorrin-7 (C(5))-methyltransferase/cobalt-precorrin-6B (C(15))-methyltransferase [Salinispora arenicola]